MLTKEYISFLLPMPPNKEEFIKNILCNSKLIDRDKIEALLNEIPIMIEEGLKHEYEGMGIWLACHSLTEDRVRNKITTIKQMLGVENGKPAKGERNETVRSGNLNNRQRR